MGGQKFQYDESGGTFFYFVLSFLALLLIPSTFYCWPRRRKEDPEAVKNQCNCTGCLKKRKILQSREPWRGIKETLIKIVIVFGWVMLLFLAYKVSQFDYEYSNFDPYEILGVPFGASQASIRKAYHSLSKVLHPDKKETGDAKAFMRLVKAHQALTDDEARSNWEKYGNPDGPGAMSFGIALPSWIVEKENSVWVLGLYGLVFMVAMPTVVGMWWYRSIRYTGDQVLLGTTELYYYLMQNSSTIPLKRCLMILAASFEFDKKHNSEVIERASDYEEVPQLIKQLPNLGEKNREPPMCWRYSIKARALIHAHLSRIPLKPDTLEVDRMQVIKKCPYLVQEMVHCAAALVLLAYSRRVPKLLNIFTIEAIMKMSPMIVQGLWETKSLFLQLPFVQEEHLKYFLNKKRRIKSVQHLAQMKPKERRSMLRFLSDDQYDIVTKVMSSMPHIELKVRSEVVDDENPTLYTAGATVTVTVTLVRRNLGDVMMTTDDSEETEVNGTTNNFDDEEEEKDEEDAKPKRPVWLKQQRKTKKGGNKKGAKKHGAPVKPVVTKDSPQATTTTTSPPSEAGDSENDGSNSEREDNEDEDGEEEEQNLDNAKGDNKKETSGDDDDDEDDAEWERFQTKASKREKALEGRSKISHPTHCPLYPDDKQEYWWVYISDRKSNTLLTSPYHVTSLVNTEEIQLRFTAPRWTGMYTFHVCLRSDSYLGFDQMQEIKLDVKEAPEVPTEHPQWDMSDDEEEPENEAGHISEYTTDEDVEEDD
ncbi:translocation protein SEC63 homolog [Thrips palmi]|uniref:Translocation protein SEC63 homolog n=1 Tax=Thrips palmi TaxID=161013 RepID=A0A6P8YX62_THRPL|nr:translocation protein SEC63 homolog [Thrips palmi]